jgi:prevent-host-death family protein
MLLTLESSQINDYYFCMTATKSVLKSKLLEILRNLERTGEEVIITDHNRPVAMIVPWKKRSSVDAIFGPWRGKARWLANLTTPTIDEWEQS